MNELIVCDLCKRLFERKGFKRHLETKKHKLKQQLLLLEKELKKKEKEKLKILENIKPNIINNITNNIQNNNQNNNQQNIYLVNNNFSLPGKEMVNHITKEMFLNILNQTDINDVLSDLLRLIYFNENVPQNNRWCVLYSKEEYGALQYNDKTKKIERWVTEEVVNKNFEMMVNSLQPMMDGINKSELNNLQKRNLNILYCHFGRKNISEYQPHNYKKIKMFAFNNKDTPMKLWTGKGLTFPDDKITF